MLSVLLGVLAVLALPAAIAAAEITSDATLLESLFVGVPAAIVLGLLGLLLVRRGRRTSRRAVRPERIEKTLRWGRRLAAFGIYLGIIGGLALAFYAALRSAE